MPGLIVPSEDKEGLCRHEILLGLALTCVSGAAVLAESFGLMSMRFAVPFIVLPATAVVMAAILARRKLYGRLHRFADLLLAGGKFGFLATLAYDLIRPLLQLMFRFRFYPYKAIPIFGTLITGRPPSDPVAITMGWVYHFWNGISFGMMFALVRPRGGPIAGFCWGLGLQLMMFAAYPRLLQVRLDDPGFLVTGLVGHALWGVVLGQQMRKWGNRDA